MSDNNALVPDGLELSTEVAPMEEQAVVQAEDSDREYAVLSGQKGWERIAESMRHDVQMFRVGGHIKNIESLSLEDVGKLTVVGHTVATYLQKHLDKVENAVKAVADAERAKQPK